MTRAKGKRLQRRRSPHLVRREGDEKACSCGLRWPHDEDHPEEITNV